MAGKLIYVVDDEAHIRDLLRYNLELEGYTVRDFADGERLFQGLKEEIPALICLDRMLPDGDGMDFTKRLRKTESYRGVPVLLLTAKAGEADTVMGLEAGADDYLVKPFSIQELKARIRALLRRTAGEGIANSGHILEIQGIRIDPERRESFSNGTALNLTQKEFELLLTLIEGKGRVYTREELLERIWGYEYAGDTRTVDVHIHSLRKQIGGDKILTVRGVGYKFGN